ncbi:Dihydrolipoyllysine-residue acetyltransferase component of pyruvate dehydrogenase complex [Colletotrichum sp. SAR 10_70]|uniref:Dihydrolipoyllysine-residue acetyltransferase component of pyruvate dehydrogenase complex n=1 Tax=Colletotrichum siamense TaxID=690259 RepID=UPI0018725F66|nr:Dihydrolipoyllysine-residue acetyltransferase component of pyruvate dehydrogenase complex [Colletotrichum siamense]KAI8164983.1 Dihydrolipoyllysine-residue acetyltransferase component of pyruvate dehydrogenase complex [Colletotrichum sp. SAR 10_65]KAI8165827.1 Dihydrolipoyllysine-residue acetyltransferase component of pyruvate dehydrogenase complex [Colletotrichum sp. SAR 10_71]KAI8176750.1 Dihydrolipoyllysine-residue acetyltransferase component of pyruvate dehydrogenase complex [Colletotrich
MISTVLRRRVLPNTLVRSTQILRCYASYPPHQVIKMPALSPTMTAGNIGAWQKKPGDSIAPGDVLVEIETDKAQMDFEFQEEGVIAKILKDAGEKDVAVGNPIAILVDEGTDVAAFEGFTAADAGGDAAKPAPKEEAKEESKSAPTPAPEPESAPEDNSPSGKLESALDRFPNASFGAITLAKEKGINIKDVKGSGKGGKITEEDVKKAASSPVAAAGPVASYEDIPISGMRKVIASRLQESTQNNPHFYVSSSISVSKLLKLRQALNSTADGKYKLSVNDFLIKAIGVASKKVPQANSSWRGDVIRQHNTVDVSVAVSTPTGLITPIVTAVEGRGLEGISTEVKKLAKLARDGKLKPEQYQGGSISISNMGMNDAVDNFTAVINPPQATILAIGTTKKVAVPAITEDGTGVEWDDQITITGSFDHKVVDGAVGAEFLKELKKVLENPLELLL